MYKVFVEYDGCSNGPAVFVGNQAQCLRYMKTHKPPKLCTWNLVSCITNRAVSYML